MISLDTQKQLVYGAGLSAGFTMFRLIVSAIGATILIKLLLPEEYGLLRWLLTISSYSILSAQIGSDAIVTKHLVRLSTEGKREEEKRFIIDAVLIRNLALIITTAVIYVLILPSLIKHSAFEDTAVDAVLMGQIIGIAMILQSNTILSTKILQAKFYMIEGRTLEFLTGLTIIFEVAFVLMYGLFGVPIGLFVGSIVFFISGCLILYIKFRGYLKVKTSHTNIRRLFLKESSLNFGIITFNTIFITADMLMLGFFVSPKEIGYYAFAQSIATLPVPIIASVGPILYPYIIKKHTEEVGSEGTIVELSLKLTILIGLFLFGILASIGDIGVRWIFPRYTPAILIMIFLSFFFIWRSLSNNLIGPILNAYSEYVFLVKVKAIITVMNIVGNLLLIPRFGIYGALCATAFAIVFNIGITGWKTLKLTNVVFPAKSIAKMFLAMTTAIVFSTVLIKLLSSVNTSIILLLSVALLIYILIFTLMFSKLLRGFEDIDKKLLKVVVEALPFSNGINKIYKYIS